MTMTIGRKYLQRIKDRCLSRMLDARARAALTVIRNLQTGPTKPDTCSKAQQSF